MTRRSSSSANAWLWLPAGWPRPPRSRRVRAPNSRGSRVARAIVAPSRRDACPICCRAAVRSPMQPPGWMPPPRGVLRRCRTKPGRSTDEIISLLGPREIDGEVVVPIGGLVIAGVELDDLADPAAARAAIEKTPFVVSLELRETEITRMADVVFPVAPVTDKAGMFVNWEGRPRTFEAVFSNPNSLPDLRILAGIAEELDAPLGFRTVAEARADMVSLGPWDGAPRDAQEDRQGRRQDPEAQGAAQGPVGAWRPGSRCWTTVRCSSATKHLRGTARAAVARINQSAYDALGAPSAVTLAGDRGSADTSGGGRRSSRWCGLGAGQLRRQRRSRRPGQPSDRRECEGGPQSEHWT